MEFPLNFKALKLGFNKTKVYIKRTTYLCIFIFLTVLNISPSWAELTISEQEFRSLAIELAPNVDLFSYIWEINPNAQFFGGVPKNYLFWLKYELQEQGLDEVLRLYKNNPIPSKLFLEPGSDVDIIADAKMQDSVDSFSLSRIDPIHPNRMDKKTPMGYTEYYQGYLVSEKIVLGQNGFMKTIFGDGVSEIYSGKLTANFSSERKFNSTHFAKLGINHPILLALRYIHIILMEYFISYSDMNIEDFLKQLPDKSIKKVKSVISKSFNDQKLNEILNNESFTRFLNHSLKKIIQLTEDSKAERFQIFEFFELNRLINKIVNISQQNNALSNCQNSLISN